MNWKTIMKESRKDKDEVHTGGYGGQEQRRIKTSGGAGSDKDMEKEDLIELLEVSLGDINLASIGYNDNR